MWLKWCFALVAGTLVLSSVDAYANDVKSFPGAACQPGRTDAPINRNNVGAMSNIGTRPQNWVCPIVRDSVTLANGMAGAAVVISGPGVSCTLFSRNESGLSSVSINEASSVALGSGLRRAQYGRLTSVVSGYYYFYCTIPVGSSIVSYRIEEIGITD
jgi:hypothetical protein